MSAGIALTSAEALTYLLAKHAGLTVNAQSAGILYVLVFGAGTDYALLLTARYREELRRHEDRHEAMAIAMRRAGPAIIASGGTVILSSGLTNAEAFVGHHPDSVVGQTVIDQNFPAGAGQPASMVPGTAR
jgi:RND superfamily putative drug exporter